jgi:hypothetical protein
MKRLKTHPRRRTRNAVETPQSPADNLLAVVLSTRVTPQRRVMEARRLLRNGLHVTQVLAALRALVHQPSRRFRHSKSFSMANRELLRHESRGSGSGSGSVSDSKRMRLPESWRGLISGLPSGVLWIPDEEFAALPQKIAFPDAGFGEFSAKLEDPPSEEKEEGEEE